MSQVCSRCQRCLDLPAPAAFCPYCGNSLSATTPGFDPEGATLAVPPDDQATLPAPASFSSAMPERLGEYRLLRKLGQGGMGVVYEGEHVSTGRRVAVKLVDVQATDDALQRFRQEGKLASAISHPRCVFVFAADQDAGRPFIVLELMPGRTLDDLIKERGPLPVPEAIGYVRDLSEGLEQVHALGVIHRDVKPSNCFLDAEGRVKVGDFGLARSLAPDAKLTRTGTFVGTPLFASPEQIKGQALDARSDVYSVCATLYFLLTGRAPHDHGDGDSLAVLARVVSDEAPPVRTRRRDVPAGLERVLARGLARERERRYPDLAALREELLAFRHRLPGLRLLGSRFVAFCIDLWLKAPLTLLAAWALSENPFKDVPSLPVQLFTVAKVFAYFAVFESVWGCTPGKWLLGLRVWGRDDVGAPGWRLGALRALCWIVIGHLPLLPINLLLASSSGFPDDPAHQWNVMQLLGLQVGVSLLAYGLILSTVRRRNGYRCLHDILSGTRVVFAPERRRAVRYLSRPARSEVTPAGEERLLGPFRVQGELWRRGDECLLRAVDPALDRAVWVWQRPLDRPAIPLARREAFRGTRPRWLAHGEEGGLRWDAFLVPSGAPLVDAVTARGRLEWDEARRILRDLAAELAASYEESLTEKFSPSASPSTDVLAGQEAIASSPPVPAVPAAQPEPPRPLSQQPLSLSQVWLSPEGQVVLIDLPAPGAQELSGPDLLAEVACVALEGKPPEPERDEVPRVRLPGHARQLLEGLPRFGGDMDVPAFRQELAQTEDRPTKLSRPMRMMHLGLLILVQCVCCAPTFYPVAFVGMFAVIETDAQLHRGREMLVKIDGNVATLAAPALHTTMRLAPAVAVAEMLPARARLARAVARIEPYHDARLARLAPPLREGMRNQPRPRMTFRSTNASLQWEADWAARELERPPEFAAVALRVALGFLVAPVVLSLLSALILGRGLRSMILGIDVVRRDGRPASRPRCAWRALVAWLPILAVLAAARLVEEWYWHLWTPEAAPAWLLRLADVCWLGAIVVPVIVLLVILITPARSLHDRLAGTWLVPR